MDNAKLQRTLSAWVLGLSLAALAAPSYADHAWGSYHWARTSNPFNLPVGDNMTGDWKTHLYQTASDWNNGGTTPIQSAVVAGTSNSRCAMVSGTTQVCNGAYGNNGWLGLATINVNSSGHITQGSAKMNDSYFSTSYYNNPNEKLHVVCQELAHTFGLGHQSEDGSSQNSCMDYFSNTGANATSTQSTTPNQHDFEQLNIIYQHTDSPSSGGGTKPGRGKPSVADITDDPSSWGRLTSQSKNGRSSVYERHNPDSSKTLTHVFWTEEAAKNCRSCDHRFERH